VPVSTVMIYRTWPGIAPERLPSL